MQWVANQATNPEYVLQASYQREGGAGRERERERAREWSYFSKGVCTSFPTDLCWLMIRLKIYQVKTNFDSNLFKIPPLFTVQWKHDNQYQLYGWYACRSFSAICKSDTEISSQKALLRTLKRTPHEMKVKTKADNKAQLKWHLQVSDWSRIPPTPLETQIILLILVHRMVYYSKDESPKNVLHDLKGLSARTLVSH